MSYSEVFKCIPREAPRAVIFSDSIEDLPFKEVDTLLAPSSATEQIADQQAEVERREEWLTGIEASPFTIFAEYIAREFEVDRASGNPLAQYACALYLETTIDGPHDPDLGYVARTYLERIQRRTLT